MIPIFILQTWVLGLLSLGVVGSGIYFGYEWQQRSWGWDSVLKEWVFAPNFGLNQETMLFAAAIILTLFALAGGMFSAYPYDPDESGSCYIGRRFLHRN